MTEHPSLFDPSNPPRLDDVALGEALRDAAIEVVGENAPDPWWGAARQALLTVSTTFDTFTTDDVWRELDAREVGPPPEPRAMGAVMRAAQRAGLAEPTDRVRPTDRPEAHRRPVRVWRATIVY